jgi:hypothetical protein
MGADLIRHSRHIDRDGRVHGDERADPTAASP